ncbi:MAG: TetR/AcrR family transcriptional regulator [Spirochaetales bacterium]|nr:TetR/AcrR family transcriptional regulator [Spirochaetales bacterium]
MPRGFTDQEKQNIHNRLLETGKEAFGLYGIKKTSVEDLARKAGISKGAFYQFFSSKEELYFAIMRHYETVQHERMYDLLSKNSDNARVQLKIVITSIMDQVDKDPFTRKILSGDEFEYLWQKFTPEQLQTAMEADVDFASKLVETWKEKGKLKVEDPKLVTGVFRALFFLYLHKRDIGEEVFPSVVDLLLESSIEKLIEE